MHSSLWHLTGQLYAQTALPLGKCSWYILKKMMGGM